MAQPEDFGLEASKKIASGIPVMKKIFPKPLVVQDFGEAFDPDQKSTAKIPVARRPQTPQEEEDSPEAVLRREKARKTGPVPLIDKRPLRVDQSEDFALADYLLAEGYEGVDGLAALVQAKRENAAKAALLHAEASGGAVPLVGVPTLGKMPQKMSADLLAAMLGSAQLRAKGLTPVKTMARHPLDKRAGKKGADLMSYHMTYTEVPYDADMWSIMGSLCKEFKLEDINRVRGILRQVCEWRLTNAPMGGLVNRFVEGVRKARPERDLMPYLPVLLKHYPVRTNFLRDFAGKGVTDMTYVRVNPHANYGVPFFEPLKEPGKHDHTPEMLDISRQILVAISTGKFNEWVAKNPQLMVVVVKNKLDSYLVAELEKKIRPFYVYPKLGPSCSPASCRIGLLGPKGSGKILTPTALTSSLGSTVVALASTRGWPSTIRTAQLVHIPIRTTL